MVPILDPRRDARLARGHRKQVAGDVEGGVTQGLVAEIPLRVGDEIEHFPGEGTRPVRSLPAEEIERHAAGGGGADRRIAQRHLQFGGVVGVVLLLEPLVLAVAAVRIPEEVAAAQRPGSLDAQRPEIRVHILVEQTRARFQRSAAEKGKRPGRRRQVHAEGVVGIVRGNEEPVRDPAAATRPQAERFGRRLRRRRAVGIRHGGEQFGVRPDPVPGGGEQVDPLVGGTQVVEAGAVIVEAVGGRERMKIAPVRIGGIELGDVGPTVVKDAVVQRHARAAGMVRPEYEPPLGRERRAQRAGHIATGGVRIGEGGARPGGRLDAAFVAVAGAQHQVGGPVARAPLQPGLGGLAVALREVAAGLQVEPQAAEIPVGDDVDHPADGVGAVDGRGAVLQDLDPLDDVVRNRVQIDVAGYAGGRRTRHPAAAVHQHQRALGFHVAQRNLHRTRADAGAVLGKAGIARHVELRIGRGPGNGQVLQSVAQIGQPGALELIPAQRRDRRPLGQRVAAKPRTGDDDFLDRGPGLGADAVKRDGGEDRGNRQREAASRTTFATTNIRP